MRKHGPLTRVTQEDENLFGLRTPTGAVLAAIELYTQRREQEILSDVDSLIQDTLNFMRDLDPVGVERLEKVYALFQAKYDSETYYNEFE